MSCPYDNILSLMSAWGSVSLDREQDGDGGAGAGAGFDFYFSTVGFHHAPHDSEAQTGAFRFGGAEDGAKGAATVFVGHTRSCVLKLDRDIRWLGVGPAGSHGARQDGESAAIRHCLRSIEDEIKESLFQLGGFSHHRRKVGLELTDQVNILVLELMAHQQTEFID